MEPLHLPEENDFINICIDGAMCGVGSDSFNHNYSDEFMILREEKTPFSSFLILSDAQSW